MARMLWTEGSIPSQTGRLAIVTGAESGIGFETARALTERGASVVLAVRDTSAGEQAAERIRAVRPEADVHVQVLDLRSLNSVRGAAAELRDRHQTIDLLISSASVMYPPRTTTSDGFELQFGANHLGHFALTGLLLDRLLAVAGSRVVTVSSGSHRVRADIHFDDLQWEHSYNRVAAYGQSKLANVLFAYELQRRLEDAAAQTTSMVAHPGLANLRAARDLPLGYRMGNAVLAPFLSQPPAMGALPILRAATDLSATGGQFYAPGRYREALGAPVLITSSPASHDVAVQQRLWAVSEELTGVSYPPLDSPSPSPHHRTKETKS